MTKIPLLFLTIIFRLNMQHQKSGLNLFYLRIKDSFLDETNRILVQITPEVLCACVVGADVCM